MQNIVENKLGITAEIEFDHCCTGNHKRNQFKPKTIVCRLLRFKDKEKVLQNSKHLNDTGIFIYKDFFKATMEFGKSLWEEALEHRRKNKIAYLNYRRVVLRDRR